MKNFAFFTALLFTSALFSQSLDVQLQVRPRFEFRNGYKTLLTENSDPAAFVSQRSRLILQYEDHDLKMKFSPQSVNIWGESPTMRLQDNNAFSIFEAYGQYQLNQTFMIRVGRQVLAYDNQRILGEVNWAQQGQSHDAALISWKPAANHKLDLAFAYNAETENLVKSPYLVNSYQNLQLAWFHFDLKNVGFSLLVLNTGYEFETELTERKTDYLQTLGAFHNFNSGNFYGDAGAYVQTGGRNNREVSAWYGGFNLNYKIKEKWLMGIGTEYLSGTDMGDTSKRIKSFTPLFGTNHAFNGFMDYFYVGNHINSVGLLDLYGRFSYVNTKFEFTIMPHYFSSAATIVDPDNNFQENYLGTEIDLSAGYKLRKALQLNLGYSQMFGSESLVILKGGENDKIQNWAWIMLSFSPELFRNTKAETLPGI